MVADRLGARTDGLVDYEELYRLLLKTPPPQVGTNISSGGIAVLHLESLHMWPALFRCPSFSFLSRS